MTTMTTSTATSSSAPLPRMRWAASGKLLPLSEPWFSHQSSTTWRFRALRLRDAFISTISFVFTTSLRMWTGQTGHTKLGEGAQSSGRSWTRAVDSQCQVHCQLTPPSCLQGCGQSLSRTYACLSSYNRKDNTLKPLRGGLWPLQGVSV